MCSLVPSPQSIRAAFHGRGIERYLGHAASYKPFTDISGLLDFTRQNGAVAEWKAESDFLFSVKGPHFEARHAGRGEAPSADYVIKIRENKTRDILLRLDMISDDAKRVYCDINYGGRQLDLTHRSFKIRRGEKSDLEGRYIYLGAFIALSGRHLAAVAVDRCCNDSSSECKRVFRPV